MPARVNSPRLAPFPPATSTSPLPSSSNRRTCWFLTAVGFTIAVSPILVEHGDDTAVAVHADPLSRLDHSGCRTRADHCRHAILAGHDCGVGHGAPDVGDRGLDLAEQRAPARCGDPTDQDLPLADVADLVHVHQHTRGPLDRSEEHTSELQSRQYLVCRLLLEKKK